MLYHEKNYKKFIILFILIITLVMLLGNYNYEKYYIQDGYVIDQNIDVYVKKDIISNIYNKPIRFLNKEINYKIMNISEDFYENGSFYKKITLSLEIDPLYLKENNILRLNFSLGKTNIIREIYKNIKKGMGI
jgi:hypothetical protein